MLYMQIAAIFVGILFLLPASTWEALTKYLKDFNTKTPTISKVEVKVVENSITDLVSDWTAFRAKCANAGLKDVVVKMDEMFPMFLQVYNEK